MAVDRPVGRAWFGAGGEARLQALREIKRRYVWMVGQGSMPPSHHRERDATGERQRLPCQDGVVVQHTSCGAR